MAGIAESYHYLGLLALHGTLGKADPDLALVYFESGANQDDPDCTLDLACMHAGACVCVGVVCGAMAWRCGTFVV